MKFFGRTMEVDELRGIRKLSRKSARMTVVTGRRRVGKTGLVRQALDDGGAPPFLYFLITRAPQSAVCESLQGEIARVFGRPMPGRIERFARPRESYKRRRRGGRRRHSAARREMEQLGIDLEKNYNFTH